MKGVNLMHSANDVNHAEMGEDSHATVADIADYRENGLIAEPYVPGTIYDLLMDNENTVNAQTLQRENRIAGGGGSKNKNRKKAVRPLTGPQRIEKHWFLAKETSQDAYLGETETQHAERLLRESLAEIERAEKSKGGRPRKGNSVRERVSIRIEPEVKQRIEASGLTVAEFVETQAATLDEATYPGLCLPKKLEEVIRSYWESEQVFLASDEAA